jgi:hypothetical protein
MHTARESVLKSGRAIANFFTERFEDSMPRMFIREVLGIRRHYIGSDDSENIREFLVRSLDCRTDLTPLGEPQQQPESQLAARHGMHWLEWNMQRL